MISTGTLQAVVRKLDTDSLLAVDRGVTLAEAELVLSSMIGRDDKATPEEASLMARNLVGLYPAREVNDGKAYAAGMAMVLAAHPLDFVRRVCDPVKGLPSRLKWLPTIADVTAAINEERARRDRIAANARYVIAEHERRARERIEAEEFERNRLPADERARRVAEIVAQFRSARDDASLSEYPPSAENEAAA